MKAELNVTVPRDGCVALDWASEGARAYTLLIIRTGAVPAYTSMRLSGDTRAYQINNLSRHQRYRFAVIAIGKEDSATSHWVDVTPRAGLQPRAESDAEGIAPYVAGIERVTVMPQDARLTVYWKRTAGFVDKVALDLIHQGRVVRQLVVEPEVTSLSLDADRGTPLTNGQTYGVRVHTIFAAAIQNSTEVISCTPAPQGEERPANDVHGHDNLIYASLSLSPEVQIFAEEEAQETSEESVAQIVCFHCRQVVHWHGYRLRCEGCGAEFIPNGRGDFLDVGRLRFGTCKCCLPKKILVQRAGSPSLCCSHSGKEHIRMPGMQGYQLIEDLPYGLCQCCRPRRPLIKRGERICCSKSNERHVNENGTWALVPSDPVFDAAAIDDLLDAGLADICSTGVSRSSA